MVKLSPPVSAFIFSRIFVLLVLVLGSQVSVSSIPAREGTNYNTEIRFDTPQAIESIKTIMLSADAAWYLEIAKYGYHSGTSDTQEPKNWVFFPLFPLAVKGLSTIIGSPLLSALLISNAAFLIALQFVYLLCRQAGFNRKQAELSVWYLALFPTSYFFSSPLTESLFLCLLCSSFFTLNSKKPILSSCLFALLTATRPTGILLLPGYAVAIAEQGVSKTKGLISLLIAPLGAVCFMLFLHAKTGSPFSFIYNQVPWGRSFELSQLIKELFSYSPVLMKPWNFILVNLASAVLGLCVSIIALKEKKFSWAILVIVPILVSIASGSLLSMTRFVMVLFPVFLILGNRTLGKASQYIVIAIFSGLLSVMTLLYALHVTAAMA